MNDILVLSAKEAGFTVHSIVTSLENANLNVDNLSISSSDIVKHMKDAELILLVGGDEIDKMTATLSEIKEACLVLDKYIVLYGLPEENKAVKQNISETVITSELIRPLTPNELVEEVAIILRKVKTSAIRKKILVVDDSGMMLRTIMSWLEDRFEVMLANSAARAFTVLGTNTPDLILLDYEMPICSGASFFEMLRAEDSTKDIPVIFLTSRGDAETVREVLELKPEGYLLKTTPKDLVIEKIDSVLSM